MAKKRRNVAGPAQRAPTATPVDHKAIEDTLQTLETYYDQLSGKVVKIPTTLERTLLLHSLVALAVQNALMVVQTVSAVQIASTVGIAFWMMRKNLMRVFLPRVAFITGSDREYKLRRIFLGLAVVGLGATSYLVESSLNALHLLAFAVAFLLDAVSIYLVKGAQSNPSRRQFFLSAVEAAYLVTGLPICVNFKEGWIYDIMAFALTATTAFVHVGVLLMAKHVVLHCFGLDTKGDFTKTKRRGTAIIERLWLDVERFESDQVLVGSSKKKKPKSKIRASPLKTRITDYDANVKQSVFKDPRVQFAILTLVQSLLLIVQVTLSAFVLYSWEMISALMLSSSHVLWTLGRARRNVLSLCTIGSGHDKLKRE